MSCIMKSLQRLSISLLTVTISILSFVFAQEEEDPQTREKIEAIITQYTTAYSKLAEGKNKAAMLELCDENIVSSIFYFGISGNSRVYQSDYRGLEKHLDKILRTEGVMLKYEVQDIPWIYTKDHTAAATYVVDYEIKEPEGIWVKGKESVTMGLRKVEDEWKIVRLTVLGFDDERLKGTCLTELFVSESEDGEVITKTTVPSGQSYNTFFNNFDFTNTPKGSLIRTPDETFRWTRESGELAWLDRSGEGEEAIGNAESKRDIVISLLKDYYYKGSCSSMKIHKK